MPHVVALTALAAALVVVALPAQAAAATCFGKAQLSAPSQVDASWLCNFDTPEFWIVANKQIDYVSGFDGFMCTHYVEDELGPGRSTEPTTALDCGEPSTETPRPTDMRADVSDTPFEWVNQSAGRIRSLEPACSGEPLIIKGRALNVPYPPYSQDDPSGWTPDDGYDNDWVVSFSFPLLCGTATSLSGGGTTTDAPQGEATVYTPPLQKTSATGDVKAFLSCTVACNVSMRGTIRIPVGRGARAARTTTLRLKLLTKHLTADQTGTFKWKLTPAQRKRIRHRNATARLAATIVGDTGARATVRKTVKIR